MLKLSIPKMPIIISLLFVFLFFIVIEWRWEFMFLGMWDFRPYAFATAISCLVVFARIMDNYKERLLFWATFLLILYCGMTSIINIPELLIVGSERYKLSIEIGTFCLNVALFIVASNRNFWKYIYAHPKMILISFLLITSPIFLIILLSGYALEACFYLRDVLRLAGLWKNAIYDIQYQSFGDKIALLTFILLSLRITKPVKGAVLIITIASLYATGSKASMVGYIFACTSYYIISIYHAKHYVKCVFFIIISIFILFGGYVYIVGNNSLQNSDNWLMRTIAHGKNDISISGRHVIAAENQRTRNSRVILGDYKFDYKLGRPGSYTHSALGIVDYYGLPIFIAFTCIWFYLFFKLLLRKQQTFITKAALMSMLFYTLLFTIARFPPGTYLFYWVLGIAIFATNSPHIISSHRFI